MGELFFRKMYAESAANICSFDYADGKAVIIMKLRPVLFGFFTAVCAAAAVIILLSLLMYFTDIHDSAANICMYAGSAAAVIAGAFFAARTAEKRILFHSLAVGLLFVLLLIAISLVFNHAVMLNAHFFAVVLGSILASFAGAVLGNK